MATGKPTSICKIQLIDISLQHQVESLGHLFEYTATGNSVTVRTIIIMVFACDVILQLQTAKHALLMLL
jgi:hypothetical protein